MIFADFSRKVIDNVSWHSYGELLNTRGMVDQAPLSALASGANGTAQATGPGDNISPTSSVPLSLQDQTLSAVPRLLATGTALFILMPWMWRHLAHYAIHIFSDFHEVLQ